MREGGHDALSRLLQTSHGSSKDSLDFTSCRERWQESLLTRRGCWVRHSKKWSFTSSNWKSNPCFYGPMVSGSMCTSEPEEQRLVWTWTSGQMFSPSEITSQVWNLSCNRKVTGQTLLRGSKEKWETFPAGFLFIVLDQEIPNPGKFCGKLWRLFQNLSS